MKKTSIAMLMCLMASFILPSCEKAVIDEYPQMESFYVESKGLMAVSLDSVTLFENKVNDFVTAYPFAKEHEKYPLILSNIKSASLRLTITVDTTWDGSITVKY